MHLSFERFMNILSSLLSNYPDASFVVVCLGAAILSVVVSAIAVFSF